MSIRQGQKLSVSQARAIILECRRTSPPSLKNASPEEKRKLSEIDRQLAEKFNIKKCSVSAIRRKYMWAELWQKVEAEQTQS
jgi:hypothetical protein